MYSLPLVEATLPEGYQFNYHSGPAGRSQESTQNPQVTSKHEC